MDPQSLKPFETILYPDFDDFGEKVLYYAEFFRVQRRIICKVYKRMFFDQPSADCINEGHPFVVFEFDLNENTEPRKKTVEFMVDAMNEKFSRDGDV